MHLPRGSSARHQPGQVRAFNRLSFHQAPRFLQPWQGSIVVSGRILAVRKTFHSRYTRNKIRLRGFSDGRLRSQYSAGLQ
jgi:hypothetical protein